MKYVKYLLVGLLFGIVLAKSEVISWYRIQEMFKFQSFHMYGIIGSAILIGIIGIQIIKRLQLKDVYGKPIVFHDKDMTLPRYIIGGIIFGIGWSLTGACPGPIIALIGYGYLMLIVPWAAALIGTFVYGVVRDKIPH